ERAVDGLALSAAKIPERQAVVRRVGDEDVALVEGEEALERLHHVPARRLQRFVEIARRLGVEERLGDEQRRPCRRVARRGALEMNRARETVTGDDERLLAERGRQALVAHEHRDHEASRRGAHDRQRGERAARRLPRLGELEQRRRRLVGDDELHARRRVLAERDDAARAPAAHHDLLRALGERDLAAVRLDPLDEEIRELVLAAEQAREAARPRAVEASERERRELADPIRRKTRGDLDDRAKRMLARKLGEQLSRSLAWSG